MSLCSDFGSWVVLFLLDVLCILVTLLGSSEELKWKCWRGFRWRSDSWFSFQWFLDADLEIRH